MTDRELLAAELALRLLEGEELLLAQGLAASDAEFAAMVEEWDERLSPLFDEIGEAQAPPELWERIASAIRERNAAVPVDLRRKLGLWRGLAAAASAIAAVLAVVVVSGALREPPPAVAPAPEPAPMLVASITAEDGGTVLAATYRPDDERLLVVPSVVEPLAGRSHELWIIPADGTPRSLGLIDAGAPREIAVPPALAGQFAAEATLAVSVEPTGGSTTGLPTGPVIATGQLSSV